MDNLKVKELHPNQVFPYIDFNNVKNHLREISDDYTDYGSVFFIRNNNISLSVNEFGKTTMFYNQYDEKTIKDSLVFIEDAFKQQIHHFSLVK